MTYEVKARKEAEVRRRERLFEQTRKLYHECETWKEFEVRRSVELGVSPKFKLFDKFWVHYCSMNYGPFMFSAFVSIIPLIITACLVTPLVMFCGMPVPVAVILSVLAYISSVPLITVCINENVRDSIGRY